jgi:hypothetical protein
MMALILAAAVAFASGVVTGSLIPIVARAMRVADRPHDPQQGSAQGEGDGAGESGFVQHHGSAMHDAAQQ